MIELLIVIATVTLLLLKAVKTVTDYVDKQKRKEGKC